MKNIIITILLSFTPIYMLIIILMPNILQEFKKHKIQKQMLYFSFKIMEKLIIYDQHFLYRRLNNFSTENYNFSYTYISIKTYHNIISFIIKSKKILTVRPTTILNRPRETLTHGIYPENWYYKDSLNLPSLEQQRTILLELQDFLQQETNKEDNRLQLLNNNKLDNKLNNKNNRFEILDL